MACLPNVVSLDISPLLMPTIIVDPEVLAAKTVDSALDLLGIIELYNTKKRYSVEGTFTRSPYIGINFKLPNLVYPTWPRFIAASAL